MHDALHEDDWAALMAEGSPVLDPDAHAVLEEPKSAKEYDQNKSDRVHKIASERGLVVFRPGDYNLTLDLDTERQVQQYESMLELFGARLGLSEIARTTSQNGNTHVYLVTEDRGEFSREERLIIQACLGSDPKRELISLLRLRRKSRNWSQLFETHETFGDAMSWLEGSGVSVEFTPPSGAETEEGDEEV